MLVLVRCLKQKKAESANILVQPQLAASYCDCQRHFDKCESKQQSKIQKGSAIISKFLYSALFMSTRRARQKNYAEVSVLH